MQQSKRWLLVLAGALVLGGGAGFYYFRVSAAARQQEAAPVQTAVVTVGSITLSAGGSADLVADRTADLGFDAGGTLTELDVQVGDKVEAGDALARIDPTSAEYAVEQARLDLGALISSEALANAELDLAQAQDALKSAIYKEWVMQQGHRASQQTIQAAGAELVLAESQLEKAQAAYDKVGGSASDDPAKANAYLALYQATQRRDSALRTLNWYTGHPTDLDQANLEGEVRVAQATVDNAQSLVDVLTKVSETNLSDSQAAIDLLLGSGPDGPASIDPTPDLIKLRQAALNLKTAQADLAATTLTAPFAATVMAVNGSVGGAAPGTVVTLTDTSHLIVDIAMDESDLDMASAGNAIQVTLDAYPDLNLTGEITRVDPSLVTLEGVQTVHAVGSLDPESQQRVANLPYGLSASVEVIAASARNVLLVPVEALHELSAGQYGVFVMVNGVPTLRVVEVGLQSPVFAEIKSGLQEGDVVTTGVVQSQ